MIKFPYGVSDFYKLITEDYVYVDRTRYLRTIEEMGNYLLFLRPRRFGKSLWLTTLCNYYDVAKEKDFERLFGHLEIGSAPTPLHNRYFILEWDFSCVRTYGTAKEIEQSVFSNIISSIKRFSSKYKQWLPRTISFNAENPFQSFTELLSIVSETSYRMYLLIDEYDNFANEVLASRGKDRYEELVGSDGLLKYIFREVKAATKGIGLDRVFATGVTPVVMSDISSGANIFLNISQNLSCSKLCGFTESELTGELAALFQQLTFSPERLSEAIHLMSVWYNGYRFHLEQDEKIYNPTLCLYFLNHLRTERRYPSQILDSNLAPDEDKLRYIQSIPGGQELLSDLLQGDTPVIISQLSDRFGLKAMLNDVKDRVFLSSFLWYSGVVTIAEQTVTGELRLDVPNLVIRRLYVEESLNHLLPGVGAKDDALIAAKTLYQAGDMKALSSFIETRIFPVYSNRDLRHANELTVKTLFLTLLFNDTFYLMMSEQEHRKGYPDLAMVVRPDCRKFTLLDIVIEFKYISLKELGMTGEMLRQKDESELLLILAVKEKLAEGKAQAERYAADLTKELTIIAPSFAPSKWVVVSLGLERILWEKV